MSSLSNNSSFWADYERLKAVALNPVRHAAPNAYEHCEMVRERAVELAKLNDCTDEEIATLEDLARLHDIGKIAGNANPVESVALLASYGITDEPFTNLVKYHDTNLPWYQVAQRGEPPTDKAWNKMARKVNMRLLCLFMVADRVDCPGGWRANAPLVWFLQEAEKRSLLGSGLVLNDGPQIPLCDKEIVEESAGCILVQRAGAGDAHALVIRVRQNDFEVPKGHVEAGETGEEAALRELREETGLISSVAVTANLGTLEYSFEQNGSTVCKRVHYFTATPSEEDIEFDEKPAKTKELRWVSSHGLDALPLVNEALRDLIRAALRPSEK
jgi:8-oxo-dGTP pyrophosphatase MutT (NUDIX family)